MSAVDEAKRALKACEDGIALIMAQQKANQALVDDYNRRSADVTAKREAYNAAKSERQRQQQDWDARKNAIKRDLLGELIDAGCATKGTQPGCPGGWKGVSSRGC